MSGRNYFYRRNADEDIRELERQTPEGDEENFRRLLRAKLRAGKITHQEYLIQLAALGDKDAVQEVVASGAIHPSLICESCDRLMQPMRGPFIWAVTYKCGGCGIMYKVHCGQRMNHFGHSRMGPAVISCDVCEYEKDFD